MQGVRDKVVIRLVIYVVQDRIIHDLRNKSSKLCLWRVPNNVLDR